MKFRSKFEKNVFNECKGKIEYEPKDARLNYNRPSKYLPDFRLPNGILIETKGRFTSTDRSKMLRVKEQNPHVDIRFVFQRANNRLTKAKNSKTYWQWCEQHGFQWSQTSIPESWWKE